MHELQSTRQQQVLPDLSSTWRDLTVVTAISAGFGLPRRPQSRQLTRLTDSDQRRWMIPVSQAL